MKQFVKFLNGDGKGKQIGLKRICAVLLTVAAIVTVSTASLRKRNYVVSDGSETLELESYAKTPEEAISESGLLLGPGDTFEVIEQGGETRIDIRRAVLVKVTTAAGTSVTTTLAENVGEVLEESGIQYEEEDSLNCDVTDPLSEGMEIVYKDMETVQYTDQEVIPHRIQYLENDGLFDGKELTLTEGQDGLKTLTYEKVYEDGVLIEENQVDEEINEEPQNEVIAVGTREPVVSPQPMEYEYKNGMGIHLLDDYEGYMPSTDDGHTVTTFTGEKYEYEYVLPCIATAYSCDGVRSGTASGRLAQMGVIASDWSVLPNNTLVYVVSADGEWEYGYAVVGDNGDFSGEMVDLYMDSTSQCINFGVRHCLVYVLGRADYDYGDWWNNTKW